ncbi:hypothetical protein STANM309S_02383 [Streptomyces tanashiensis]
MEVRAVGVVVGAGPPERASGWPAVRAAFIAMSPSPLPTGPQKTGTVPPSASRSRSYVSAQVSRRTRAVWASGPAPGTSARSAAARSGPRSPASQRSRHSGDGSLSCRRASRMTTMRRCPRVMAPHASSEPCGGSSRQVSSGSSKSSRGSTASTAARCGPLSPSRRASASGPLRVFLSSARTTPRSSPFSGVTVCPSRSSFTRQG